MCSLSTKGARLRGCWHLRGSEDGKVCYFDVKYHSAAFIEVKDVAAKVKNINSALSHRD